MQEDPVLLTPEDKKQKPYVAIIKVNFLFTDCETGFICFDPSTIR